MGPDLQEHTGEIILLAVESFNKPLVPRKKERASWRQEPKGDETNQASSRRQVPVLSGRGRNGLVEDPLTLDSWGFVPLTYVSVFMAVKMS